LEKCVISFVVECGWVDIRGISVINMFRLNIYVLLYVISKLVLSYGYFITVDAHAEECFFDKVESGTKMGI
jgi:hypothetical protein